MGCIVITRKHFSKLWGTWPFDRLIRSVNKSVLIAFKGNTNTRVEESKFTNVFYELTFKLHNLHFTWLCLWFCILLYRCVKTNVRYMVVGSFITVREDETAIAEGLQKLKDWNPTFAPRVFMIDFAQSEANAIRLIFGILQVIRCCEFHRLLLIKGCR